MVRGSPARFQDTVAWLACHAAFTVLAALLRITWRSVAAVITRVVAARAAQSDRLTGLRRIGVDEISYRKGHRYLLCVVDHDTGRLVWADQGRDSATLRRFFDALGEERSALLTHISADGAEWIHAVATERAPQAVVCLDAFHVVAWATAALDAVRRGLWNQLRRDGKTDQAKALKGSRWALLKTHRISPATSAPPWRPSRRPTIRFTAPTCSKIFMPLARRSRVDETWGCVAR
jgi:transposase